MNYKVIATDQREYGPISAEQVRQWILERRLNSMCLAQAEGANEWKSLGMIPEFHSALGSPLPPAAALPPLVVPAGQRVNTMAVLGLIMGLLTVTCGPCCCCGCPFCIFGVIFSLIGMSQIARNPHLETGKGMAVTGLILSVAGPLLYGLLSALVGLLSNLDHPPRMFHL